MTTYTESTDGDFNAAILGRAVYCARPISEKSRGTFPRFTLKVDGDRLTFNDLGSLRRAMSTMLKGHVARIWRNAGQGATISFDGGL